MTECNIKAEKLKEELKLKKKFKIFNFLSKLAAVCKL